MYRYSFTTRTIPSLRSEYGLQIQSDARERRFFHSFDCRCQTQERRRGEVSHSEMRPNPTPFPTGQRLLLHHILHWLMLLAISDRSEEVAALDRSLTRSWEDYARVVVGMNKSQFVEILAKYRADRPKGDQQHLRRTDELANSRSPMMLYGVPVGKISLKAPPACSGQARVLPPAAREMIRALSSKPTQPW